MAELLRKIRDDEKRRKQRASKSVYRGDAEADGDAEGDGMPARLIGKPEVIDRTGVSFVTLWSWMKAGEFPLARQVGNRTMWLEHEVEAWVRSRPVKIYRAG